MKAAEGKVDMAEQMAKEAEKNPLPEQAAHSALAPVKLAGHVFPRLRSRQQPPRHRRGDYQPMCWMYFRAG